MGQKVHPTGIRLGVVKDHNSVWYADSKTYAQNLINDLEVREYILKKLDAASVSRVKIERPLKLRVSRSLPLDPALSSARRVKTLTVCARTCPPRWVCRFTSTLKKFASPTWMRVW